MSDSGNNNQGKPTLACAAVSSQHDALVVFEAARRGLLPVMRHRLADCQKDIHIKPGSVYIWEEAHASDRSSRCLRRWTDGVKWSQSRMREPFLFYEEVPPFERTEQDRRNRARHPSRRDRIIKPDGLKKLTFTALVRLQPDDTLERYAKWHLVCYMTQNDRSAPPAQELKELKGIDVPDGVYFDAKGVPLDNTPRQTVRWPRSPDNLCVDTRLDQNGMSALTPPHSETSLYSPMHAHGPHGMHLAPMSPPATPGDMSPPGSPMDWQSAHDRSPYSAPKYYPHPPHHPGHPSQYMPSTPPHIATAPPAPRPPQHTPAPYLSHSRAYPQAYPPPPPPHSHPSQQGYDHSYSSYRPGQTERLPSVSEMLNRPQDLDNPLARQLPPINTQAWGQGRRESEDMRTLYSIERSSRGQF